MSLKTIRIDVISDFVCAWCYLGHIELEQGMALAKERGLPVSFSLRYHPMFLNNCLNDETAVAKGDYFAKKFPNAEEGAKVLELLARRGMDEGIAFSFNGNIRQTTRAHRLCQKAYNVGGERAQCAMLRRLFRALCEQEKDIGDPHTLALLSSSATHPFSNPPKPFIPGVDPIELEHLVKEMEAKKLEAKVGTCDCDDDDAAQIFDSEEEALEWIEGKELEAEVKKSSYDAAMKGVKGVPFTVIDGRWAVSGCQKPECYYKIFERIVAAEMCAPKMPNSAGIQQICGPSTSSTPCVMGSATHQTPVSSVAL